MSVRAWRALAVTLALLAGVAWANPPQPIVVIPFHGTVQPVTAEYIVRGLNYAQRQGAAAVVLEIDTPGGLETSMRAIVHAILASSVPVVCYVSPVGARAASAGFFILESCDVAAMAPGTNAGAAHPVFEGANPGKIMMQKVLNDADAFLRSYVAVRGRNVPVAQTAVDESKSFSDTEALQQHLIDLTAPTLKDLLAQLNGKPIKRFNGTMQTLSLNGPQLVWRESLRERILGMDPSLAFILLVAGGILIYIEFHHPGMFAPGALGAVLVALALFSMSILPIDWAAAGLLLVGFVLFILEAHFPTHGVLAVGGIVAFFFGAIFLVQGPIPQMRIAWSVALGAAAGMAAVVVFLTRLVLRVRRTPPMLGEDHLVGAVGCVRAVAGEELTIAIGGDLWRGRSSRPVSSGAKVRVRAVHGFELEVEPEADERSSTAS